MTSVTQLHPRVSSLTDEELAARIGKITSTTAHAVVTGEGQHQAYRRIMGIGDDPFKDGLPDHVALGVMLEDGIRQFAEHKTGLYFDKPHTIIHPKHPFIADSADGLGYDTPERDRKEPVAALECKLHGSMVARQFGEPGSDEVPERTYIQAQWHNMAHGTPVCYVVPVLAGFVMEAPIYKVKRDLDLEEAMIEKATIFHREYITKGVEPPLDGLDSTVEFIKKKYADVRTDTYAEATGSEEDTALALLDIRDQYKKLEERKKALENMIKDAIGDHRGIEGQSFKAVWSMVKGRAKTDWKSLAQELGADHAAIEKYTVVGDGYRRFTIKGAK